MRRALARAEAADLVLLLLRRQRPDPFAGLHAGLVDSLLLLSGTRPILPGLQQRDGLRLSLKTGEGLAELIATLTQKVAGTAGSGRARRLS